MRRKRRVWSVLAYAVIATLAAGPIWGRLSVVATCHDERLTNTAPRPQRERVSVPDLADKTLREAMALLRRRGLAVGDRLGTNPPELTDRVVRQKPLQGTMVDRGTQVTVWLSRGGTQVPVPKVIGLNTLDAERTLADAKLQLGAVEDRASEAQEGTIVDQQPKPGELAQPGAPVNVWVAAPRPPDVDTVPVPDLAGKTLREARAALRREGLALGDPLGPDPPRRTDTVVRQDPPQGTMVDRGTTVRVWLSRGDISGPVRVSVPNVIGQDTDDAERTLTDAQLRLGTVERQPSEAREGTIISQTPAPGTEVPPDSRVDVSVAGLPSPPEELTPIVPNLWGRSVNEAREMLAEAGLVLGRERSESSDQPPGSIVRQAPRAGGQARRNRTVDVWTAEERPVVPKVVGISFADAEATLRQARLSARIPAGANRDDIVATQRPAAGTEVAVGTVVEIEGPSGGLWPWIIAAAALVAAVFLIRRVWPRGRNGSEEPAKPPLRFNPRPDLGTQSIEWNDE